MQCVVLSELTKTCLVIHYCLINHNAMDLKRLHVMPTCEIPTFADIKSTQFCQQATVRRLLAAESRETKRFLYMFKGRFAEYDVVLIWRMMPSVCIITLYHKVYTFFWSLSILCFICLLCIMRFTLILD